MNVMFFYNMKKIWTIFRLDRFQKARLAISFADEKTYFFDYIYKNR